MEKKEFTEEQIVSAVSHRNDSQEKMATNHLSSAPPTNSWETWSDDELVEERHCHRAEIADRFDCNLEGMYEYYLSMPIDPEVCRAISTNDPETRPSGDRARKYRYPTTSADTALKTCFADCKPRSCRPGARLFSSNGPYRLRSHSQ